jgi:hypothetical protein
MMKFSCSSSKHLRRNIWILAILLASAWQVQAVQWTLTSAGPPVWTYTLTFDPLDNCNLFVSPTTITMTGLTGVTGAGAPTSSDFTGSFDTSNRAYTPSVLNGGTKVVWTNTTCGTGNFNVAMRVIGFTVTAPTAPNGTVSFATSGIARDTGVSNSLDISGSVAGPGTAGAGTPSAPTGAPAASPLTLVVLSIGLAAVGAWQVKRRMFDRLMHGE